MKVSIVKDWDHPNFFRQTPGGSGVWDDIIFEEGSSILMDILVVLNTPPKDLVGFCRRGGKWLMSQEPPHEFYKAQTKSYSSFDKVFTFWNPADFPHYNIINTQTSLPWHIDKTYDELMTMHANSLPQKLDEVSWITSNLNKRPGHAIRLAFMEFLDRTQFPYHLFGRGFQPIEDKFDGISPYKYSIAIENFACNDYWTEKIADCFLSWSLPIYYGCTNITKYFPEKSMLLINPHQPEIALRKIQEAIATNLWEECLPYIAEARQLILNKYQFFPAITEKLKAYQIANAKRKFFFIKKI